MWMLKTRTLSLLLLLVPLLGCGEDVEDVAEATPTATPAPTPEPTPPPPPWTEADVTVKSGQVITKILQDQGLDYADALALVNSAADIHDLAKIRGLPDDRLDTPGLVRPLQILTREDRSAVSVGVEVEYLGTARRSGGLCVRECWCTNAEQNGPKNRENAVAPSTWSKSRVATMLGCRKNPPMTASRVSRETNSERLPAFRLTILSATWVENPMGPDFSDR